MLIAGLVFLLLGAVLASDIVPTPAAPATQLSAILEPVHAFMNSLADDDLIVLKTAVILAPAAFIQSAASAVLGWKLRFDTPTPRAQPETGGQQP